MGRQRTKHPGASTIHPTVRRLLAENEALRCELETLRARLHEAEAASQRMDAVSSDPGEHVQEREWQPTQGAPWESEECFRLLVERVQDYAIFMLDPEGRIVNWNRGAARIKGYRADEIVGQHVARLYTPEDVAADRPARALALAAVEGRYEEEGWRVRKDGSRFWARVVITAVRDEQGRLRGFGKVTHDTTERRLGELAQAEWKNRYEAAVSSSGQLLYDWDPRTGSVVYGGAVEKLTGYTAYELNGGLMRWMEILHPEDRDAFAREIRQVSETGRAFRLNFRILCKDGQIRHCEDRGQFFRNARGELARMVGFVVDVTERVQAEQALRDNEQKLRVALESAGLGMWTYAFADELELDARAQQIYQVSASRLAHGALTALQARFHPDDLAMTDAQIRAASDPACSGQYHNELRILQPDGSVRWVRTCGLVQFEGEGPLRRPVRLIGASRDVTEEKRAEAALRDSEQRLRRLVESNIVGVGYWDAVGMIVEANEAFLNLLGFTRQELASGQLRWDVLTPPEWLDITRHCMHLLQTTGTCPAFEKELFRKDGTRVPVVVAAAAFEPSGGDTGVAFILDVSERKRAEQALRESEQKLHRLFQQAPAQIALYEGPEHVHTFANARHHRMTGNRPLIGRTLREAFPELEGQGIFEYYDHVYATGEPSVVTELRVVLDRNGDGRVEEGYFTQVLQPWFGPDGRIAGVMGFAFEVTEQVRAREAVRQSKERLRLALEAGRMGTWSLDFRTGETTWDERTRQIFGVEPDEPIDHERVLRALVHPDDRARVYAMAEQAMSPAGDGRYDIEHRVIRPDGSVRWVMVKGQVTCDGDSQGSQGHGRTALRMTGTALDVTERREIEQALRESEARFRQLVEFLPQLVWACRPDGSCDYVSPQWLAYTGQTVSAALGEGWLDALHPDDREWIAAAWQATREERGTYDVVYRLRRADGVYHWFHTRGIPLRDAQGRVVRWFGTSTDIHDRKLAEEALRDAEERFRTLADNIAQLAWMADGAGWVFWYNQRWFDYTGTTLDEMQGWGWQAVHHPDHIDRVMAKLRRCIEAGEVWEDTFPLRGKDGGYRWFLSRAIPIRDEAGKVYRWLGTNTDVTAQRQVEEALKAADRHKDDFLAMLAHELRNPLAPIRTAIQVLNLIGSSAPKAVQMRDMVERQVAHMARLIDDLLDVSRIARGKVQLRKERCDLVAIVRDVTEDYRPIFEGNGLSLSVVLPHEPLWLDGDSTRLAQVVGNLLHNANKFTGQGGEICVRVEVEPSASAAVIRVSDTGMGIEPTMLAHIFEPFTQDDRSLDRSRGGLGLGLALVKGLIELHGGTVSAHSEGRGRGATFTLRLLLDLADAAALRRPVAAAAEAHGRLRILVIEDNRDAADSLKDLLTLLGHDVDVAHAGPAGLEAARAAPPAVVLCDIGLPNMDGFEVARALRQDPATRGVYLIAQTGYGQDEDQRRAHEAGFDLYLTKPVDLSLLQRVLASVEVRR